MQSLKNTQRSSRSKLTHRESSSFTKQRRGRNVAALFLFKERNNNTELSAAITGAKTSKAALDAIAEGHAKVIKK
jgi:hypothetical protein